MRSVQLFTVVFSLLAVMPAHAGSEGGNGGDPCENRFNLIRDDIVSWIQAGGAAGLDFRMLPGVDLETYVTNMLQQLARAQVECTDAHVLVRGAEKTCKNFEDESGTSRIICNRERFTHAVDTDQYVLVHHEYAGLAGLEVNHGASSLYVLSNQITAYLAEQVVKKLALKPKPSFDFKLISTGNFKPMQQYACNIRVAKDAIKRLIYVTYVNNDFTTDDYKDCKSAGQTEVYNCRSYPCVVTPMPTPWIYNRRAMQGGSACGTGMRTLSSELHFTQDEGLFTASEVEVQRYGTLFEGPSGCNKSGDPYRVLTRTRYQKVR